MDNLSFVIIFSLERLRLGSDHNLIALGPTNGHHIFACFFSLLALIFINIDQSPPKFECGSLL